MFAGQLCFFYNLYMTWRDSRTLGAPAIGGAHREPPLSAVPLSTS
jgi:hypothetical protein